MTLKSWLFIIPARLESTRLENKPLQDLAGKPLVIRVADNLAPLVDEGAKILVATDSQEVLAVCKEHGYSAVMTQSSHMSGTDRCNEACVLTNSSGEYSFVMNVQGDEPFVSLEDLKVLAKRFEASDEAQIGTLAFKSQDKSHYLDPAFVKLVIKQNGMASYFSRSPIPHGRVAAESWPGEFWEHLGVYAFRTKTLSEFCNLSPTNWEKTEKLEQLRALENNWNILVQAAHSPSLGIDTQKDLEEARAKFK